jgi:hypothetical protein
MHQKRDGSRLTIDFQELWPTVANSLYFGHSASFNVVMLFTVILALMDGDGIYGAFSC